MLDTVESSVLNEVAGMHKAFRFSYMVAALLLIAPSVSAETIIKRIPTQYIAALGDPAAKSGVGAENWGLWPVDPGPRGVRLTGYSSLKEVGRGGVTDGDRAGDYNRQIVRRRK